MTSNIRNNSSTSSNAITVTTLNGEPRIQDLLLAENLGFSEPRAIRKLIKRNEEKLLSFGTRDTVSRVTITGQPIEEYYLNQKQALFICMKSETDRAFDVQVEIIRVFDAYLNGDLKPTTADATVASQPRLYYAAQRTARSIGMERDAGSKQAMIYQLQAIHDQLGLRMPPIHLFGKPADQMQLEV